MRNVIFTALALTSFALQADIARYRFESGDRYLVIELLDDDLAHIEISENRTGPNPDDGLYISPMIDQQNYDHYRGPKYHRRERDTIETDELSLSVEDFARCVRIFDRKRGVFLTRICGENLSQDTKTLAIEKGTMTEAYGLGNLFKNPTTADGDWVGENWVGRNTGNFRFGYYEMDDGRKGSDSFHGGGPSVSQFPMLYAVGQELDSAKFANYGLLVDTIYRTGWDLRGEIWRMTTWGDQVRFFVSAGDTLRDLRLDYMELVGRPKLPPKAAFGLCISEFGYDNWNEIREDLDSLKKNGFPVDMVALDLQWFGGGFGQPGVAKMGTLRFNETNFPNPEQEIARFYSEYGIRFIPIEESYIDSRLPEYAALKERRYLAGKDETRTEPVHVVERDFVREPGPGEINWWGVGGMIDWSNSDAGAYWHKDKRVALGLMGIFSHWLDLGEPEMYNKYAYYYGHPKLGKNRHGDVHNIYNLKWAQSIADGYEDEDNQRLLREKHRLVAAPRFFTMSRSGTIGSHRYGAMWSGDVGRNLGNLRGHANTQMNMSLLGVDYYGSDAGGFLPAGMDDPGHSDGELYTQWLANNTLTDVPVRPHGWALEEDRTGNQYLTPDRKGDVASNRANILRRYELTPYIYSLAHQAYLFGEPVFPPMVYHFQGERRTRKQANLKLIGDSLLMGMVAGYGQQDRPVDLPRGTWIDYESLDWHSSNGQTSPVITLRRKNRGENAVFMPPLLAKRGAIIPINDIVDTTKNLGQYRGETLKFRVFAGDAPTQFTLYEDDGVTVAYQKGRVRKTRLSQKAADGTIVIGVGRGEGSYEGAPNTRNVKVELIVNDRRAKGVTVGGQELQACVENGSTSECWRNAGRNRIAIDIGSLSVSDSAEIRVSF